MIWKVLGIVVVLTFAGAAAQANETSTGPPDTSVQAGNCFSIYDGGVVADSDIGVQFGDVAIDIFGTANHGTDVAASDIGVEFDGLLKGPRSNNIAKTKLEANDGSATGVDLLGAGKIDAAIFMGDESPRENLAFIHRGPPAANTGSCGLICEI